MKAKLKRVWRTLRAKLPTLSRKGRVIRNLVTVILLAFCCWLLLDAPAFSAEQEYYRAARQNLLGDTEILTIVDTSEWPYWTSGNMLAVAEDEERYVVCLSSYYLECWEKQGDVMLAAMPPHVTLFPTDNHPFLLMTALPAVRAEVEFTLPPELSWSYYDDFEGVTLRGEAEGENGVFLFHFPEGLQELQMEYSRQRQLQGQALLIFADVLRGRAEDYGCSVEVSVRLWDESGSLIYDDVLTYHTGTV